MGCQPAMHRRPKSRPSAIDARSQQPGKGMRPARSGRRTVACPQPGRASEMTSSGRGGRGNNLSGRTREGDDVEFPDYRRLDGVEVTNQDGEKLGKVDGLFVDDQVNVPTWAAVRSGIFGSHHSLAPLAQ